MTSPYLAVYRITAGCAHMQIHGPVQSSNRLYIGEAIVCELCPKIVTSDGDEVHPMRQIVKVDPINPNEWHGNA